MVAYPTESFIAEVDHICGIFKMSSEPYHRAVVSEYDLSAVAIEFGTLCREVGFFPNLANRIQMTFLVRI